MDTHQYLYGLQAIERRLNDSIYGFSQSLSSQLSDTLVQMSHEPRWYQADCLQVLSLYLRQYQNHPTAKQYCLYLMQQILKDRFDLIKGGSLVRFEQLTNQIEDIEMSQSKAFEKPMQWRMLVLFGLSMILLSWSHLISFWPLWFLSTLGLLIGRLWIQRHYVPHRMAQLTQQWASELDPVLTRWVERLLSFKHL